MRWQWLHLLSGSLAVEPNEIRIKKGRILIGHRVVNKTPELGIPALEWTESDGLIFECSRRLLSCYGGHVPEELLKELNKLHSPEDIKLKCFAANLFSCETRWTHVRYGNPVWFAQMTA
eukprot:g22160.t1